MAKLNPEHSAPSSEEQPKFRVSRPLQNELVTLISIILFLLTLLAAWITYSWVLDNELKQAEESQNQLVLTIQSQANVGIYAENEAILQDVIDGLLANPIIQGVRLTSKDGELAEGGHFPSGMQLIRKFPVFSPEDSTKEIGTLSLSIDHKVLHDKAVAYALSLSAMLVFQSLLVALLVGLIVQHKLTAPLVDLAYKMASVKDESGDRLRVDRAHAHNEIGLLCTSANHFIETAEKAIQKANNLARHDPLTGLHNRRAFLELGKIIHTQSIRYQWPYSIIMMDIDHFKSINDTYGHDGGDQVLIAVAKVIRHIARASDVDARFGGEEFIVLMPETDTEEARALAERLRRMISEMSLIINSNSISITASLGVASNQAPCEELDCIIKRADEAMYVVKRSGRNGIRVYDENSPSGAGS